MPRTFIATMGSSMAMPTSHRIPIDHSPSSPPAAAPASVALSAVAFPNYRRTAVIAPAQQPLIF
jgi:hypothetical protein